MSRKFKKSKYLIRTTQTDILVDRYASVIRREDVLLAESGKSYRVINDKDFGISIKCLQTEEIEKLTQEVALALEKIYLSQEVFLT